MEFVTPVTNGDEFLSRLKYFAFLNEDLYKHSETAQVYVVTPEFFDPNQTMNDKPGTQWILDDTRANVKIFFRSNDGARSDALFMFKKDPKIIFHDMMDQLVRDEMYKWWNNGETSF